ncbi:MAG: acetyl-CoA C-acyltransferase [Gammaproteobacteria bacterium CG22_combo_CG10-13_8_21_14_all_40_8]|nr:MAG: acetyl-CoA C-acyltransferase [Gammaproteobacteria bacterium CG22_combo_CG10-13_8_21_14_all_40_8]
MNSDPIVIVSATRTPLGGMSGSLATLTGPELGAIAIKGAVEQCHIDPSLINEVFMGCVLPAGTGQAPARQAALGAGLPHSAGSTTINKVCGSGMKSIMLAHDLILAGSGEVMVAGGMESMTNAPYLLAKARGGFRLGHGEIKDSMFLDGLEDAYDKGKLMGVFAQETADSRGYTREQQDEFTIRSLTRAQNATKEGWVKAEITPVTYSSRAGEVTVSEDELPQNAKLDKIPSLRPAFSKTGTITAANASSISDGAAALILMKASKAKELGLHPLAKIVAHATHARKPAEFTQAPVGAIKALFEKTGWSQQHVDLFEINEAFAMVTMIAIDELALDTNKVNIYGGAVAVGHPLGASGARIVVTLLNALKQTQGKKGVASLCIGGGEATAIALELC